MEKLFRHARLFITLILGPAAMLTLTGCALAGPPSPTPAGQAVPTTPLPTNTPVDGVSASDTPAQLSEDMHHFECGLEVQIPPGWSVETGAISTEQESIWLRAGETSIGVEVYPRPQNERELSDPRTWQPNEGGYEAHWLQEIEVGDLRGVWFVWGALQGGAWDTAPTLMAIFFDPERELDIRLSTDFTRAGLAGGIDLDLQHVIATRFVEFRDVLESLRFESARSGSGFLGVLRTGSELSEAKSYCPEGFYLVNETGMLLLRVGDGSDAPALFTDEQYLGTEVVVAGFYPAQEIFCEALLCECEDYILVESVKSAP